MPLAAMTVGYLLWHDVSAGRSALQHSARRVARPIPHTATLQNYILPGATACPLWVISGHGGVN
jgi:hypothetical protein